MSESLSQSVCQSVFCLSISLLPHSVLEIDKIKYHFDLNGMIGSCTSLYCTSLDCTVLVWIGLHWTVLKCVVLNLTVLNWIGFDWTVCVFVCVCVDVEASH